MNSAISITSERLRAFFQPSSIALVGATDSSLWSINTFQNLKNFAYPSPIYCVNPKYSVIHGEIAVKSLGDIDKPVDLAFIMVSTQQVYPVLKEVAAACIPNVVVLTSGFSETGARGQKLERQILKFAQSHDILMLGPNGNGFINAITQTMPYGLPIHPPLPSGPVGVILQSGALASGVISLAQARHIGLSLLVSMGNETMISTTDVMNYLIEDPETQVIALFLESIRHPAIFEQIALKALEYKKPIVALKVGRNEVSARAAKAHTGAFVGNDAINDAVFKQLGIIRVDSLEDLLTTAGLLGYTKPLSGRRMGVVTPSGGACDILADRAQEEGILLPDFAPKTMRKLQQILPPFSTIHNPLDITGYLVVDRTLLQRTLEAVIEDPGFDFVVCLSEPPRVEPPAPQLPAFLHRYMLFGTTIHHSPVPIIVFSTTNIDLSPFGCSISDYAEIHFVGGLEHGMTALGRALWWYETHPRILAREREAPIDAPPIALPDLPAGTWLEATTRDFLQSHDIPVVPAILAASEHEAVNAAQTFGFPVVLKIQATDIAHKSEIGGVLLNISSEDAVRKGFRTITRRAAALDKPIDGILVSPMRPAGIELLVGIIHDPTWGQVLALGLGGIWTEIFRDTSMRKLPVHCDDIKDMLGELRGAPLLQGARGQQPVDIEKLSEIIFRLTQLARGLQDSLDSLEINPLLLHNSNIEAVDVLITWQARS